MLGRGLGVDFYARSWTDERHGSSNARLGDERRRHQRAGPARQESAGAAAKGARTATKNARSAAKGDRAAGGQVARAAGKSQRPESARPGRCYAGNEGRLIDQGDLLSWHREEGSRAGDHGARDWRATRRFS